VVSRGLPGELVSPGTVSVESRGELVSQTPSVVSARTGMDSPVSLRVDAWVPTEHDEGTEVGSGC